MNKQKAKEIQALIEGVLDGELRCSDPINASERILREETERWNYLLIGSLGAIGSVDYFPLENRFKVNIYSDAQDDFGQYGEQIEKLLQQK